jgi:hypothetical protein
LGKVPVLVTDAANAGMTPHYRAIPEQLDAAPAMVPSDPNAALKMRQLEALADGVMEAAQALVREKTVRRRSSQKASCCASGRK